jgi:hypothetical protein
MAVSESRSHVVTPEVAVQHDLLTPCRAPVPGWGRECEFAERCHLHTAEDECVELRYQMLPTVPLRDWVMEGGSESAVAEHGESHCRPAGRWRYCTTTPSRPCRRCQNALEIEAGGYRAQGSRARQCQRRIVVVICTWQRTRVLSYAYQTLSTVAVHGCNCQREWHVALPTSGVQSHPPCRARAVGVETHR